MADTFARMKQLVGTTAEWAANNIVLGEGEIGVERIGVSDHRAKCGDGVKTWSQLPYLSGTAAAVDAQVAAASVHAATATTQAGIATTKASEASASQSAAAASQSAAASSATAAAQSAAIAQDAADEAAAFAGFRDFDSLTSLLANTSLTYSGSTANTVQVGQVLRTRAEGFSYQVVASNAAYHIATSNALPVRLIVHPGRHVITPREFGAKGDGTTDDTSALRNWISTNAGVHDLGNEAYTYIVQPPNLNDVILPIPTGSKRKIIGNGATIKIKDGSLGFYAVMGANNSTPDLSDLSIDGIVVDHNSQNNSFTITSSVLSQPRYTIAAQRGTRIIIQNITVLNPVCTNSLFINGNTGTSVNLVSDVTIDGCRWFNVGGSAVTQDHSTMYIVSDGMRISNNYAEGASLGATGTAAFIETHGTRQHVTINEAVNFVGFTNITGVYSAGDTEDSFVTGNQGYVEQHGIRLFSLSYAAHTSGYGLSNVTVSNNRMRIRQTNIPSGSSRFYMGAGIQAGATLPVRNVRFLNNVIEYDIETSTPSYTAISCAVGFNETTGTTQYDGVHISGNTIVNAPAMAIALGIGGGTVRNAVIGTNTIINAGQSLSGSVTAAFKTAIWGTANSYTGSLKIARQIITDTFDTTRLAYGCYFGPANSSTGIPCEIDLDLTLCGDRASFVTLFHNQSSRLSMLVTGRLNAPHVSTGQTFQAGSVITDTSNNLEYRMQVPSTTWTTHGFATAAPTTGAHQVGSTRINTAPAASGNFGWVCTSAGTPGTWKTFGAISA